MLQTWASSACDPTLSVVGWLFAGAPAGIALDTAVLDKLLPRVSEKHEEPFLDCEAMDPEEFVNYTGVDENNDVAEMIRERAEKQCLLGFDTPSQV